MTMPLNKITREELEHRLDVIADELEAGEDSWQDTHDDIAAALRDDSLANHKQAAEELENILGTDVGQTPSASRQINEDLARGGHLERFEAEAVYLGGRPRTITVDGKKYYKS